MRYIPGLLLLISISLALVACQAAAPAPAPNRVEDVGGVQVHEGGESVNVSAGARETLTLSGQVPSELKEFPVPPDFALSSDGFGSVQSGDGVLATATWVGNPSVADAAGFYTRSLTYEGWTQSMALESDSGWVLTFKNGDRSALLRIDQDGPTTRIALLYGSGASTDGPVVDEQLMCLGKEATASIV